MHVPASPKHAQACIQFQAVPRLPQMRTPRLGEIKWLMGKSSLNTGLRLAEGPPGPEWYDRQQPCSHTRLLPGSLETRRPEVRGLVHS